MKMNPTRRQFLRGLCLGGGALSAAVLAGCGGDPAQSGEEAQPAGEPVKGGNLVVGLSYEPDTLNVYATHLLGDVEAMFAEGLLVPNKDMEYEPVLATEVPTVKNGLITLKDDGTMDITYHLREGVKWHDGEPLTSADVKATWVALSDDAWQAESKDGVKDIDSIDCPDDLTVVCHYNRQTPDFAQTLFTFGIMPAHVIEGLDMNDPNNAYNAKPLGTGPYKFVEWKHGESITLERNDDYWGEEGPYLDTVTFRFITDENTRINSLKTGEINFTYGIGYSNYDQVKSIEGMTTIVNGLNSWRYLDFNCARPGLDDVAVRRAISCSIDKQALVDQLFGGLPIAWDQPWMPEDPYHVDGFSSEWSYDEEKAKQLLEDAGWRVGADGVREKDGVRLEYTVTCKSGNTIDEPIEQVLIDALGKVGIKVSAENYAASTWSAMLYDGDYDLAVGGYITSPGASRTVMYAEDGALNRGKWVDADFTEATHELDSELDEDKRKEIVSRALAAFDSGLPQVILFNNTEVDVYTSDLQGFTPNPTNMTNFCQSAPWWLANQQ